MIVTDERVARFVGEKVKRTIYPPYTSMGLEKNGKIVAGAVFNCWTGYDVEVTLAIDGAGLALRGFFREMGKYICGTLGCGRVTFTTEQDEVIELATRLGAQTEGRIRNHFGPGRDAILLGILKEDWRL